MSAGHARDLLWAEGLHTATVITRCRLLPPCGCGSRTLSDASIFASLDSQTWPSFDSSPHVSIVALRPCALACCFGISALCMCAFHAGSTVEALSVVIAFAHHAWVFSLALHSAPPGTCPRKHCGGKVSLRHSCLHVLSYSALRMIAGPRHVGMILRPSRLYSARVACLFRLFCLGVMFGRTIVGGQFGLGACLSYLAPLCRTLAM